MFHKVIDKKLVIKQVKDLTPTEKYKEIWWDVGGVALNGNDIGNEWDKHED